MTQPLLFHHSSIAHQTIHSLLADNDATGVCSMQSVNAASAIPTVQAYVVGVVPSAPPMGDVIQEGAAGVDPEFSVVGKKMGKSPEGRMRELDRMRSLLTKKAEILSDV